MIGAIIRHINNNRCSVSIENDPDGNWHVRIGAGKEMIGENLFQLINEGWKWVQESQKVKA